MNKRTGDRCGTAVRPDLHLRGSVAVFGSLILVAAAMLAGAGRAPAANIRLDDRLSCEAEVGVAEYMSERRAGAMVPIILVFENKGEPRTIQVTAGEPPVRAVFSIPTGRAVKRCHYLPASASRSGYYGGRCAVEFVDAASGKRLGAEEVGGGSLGGSLGSPRGSEQHLVAIRLSESSPPLINEDFDPAYKLHVTTAYPSKLPDSWLGLSTLDLVFIEHAVWAAPGFDRQMLVDWMAMGGVCLFIDTPADALRPVLEFVAAHGPFFADDKTDSFRVGLGGGVFVPRGLLAASTKNFFHQRGFMLSRPADLLNLESMHRLDLKMGEPPFWPLLGALALFSFAVGPVGWWWLVKRRNQALLYYVAAPAASLCAIVAIVIVAFVHEGFRPYLNGLSVRFVDQRVTRSIDGAVFDMYAPVEVGSSLRGSPDELVFAGESRGEFGWTVSGGRRVYAGILPVRREAAFYRTELRTERRRLVVSEDQAGIRVENLLGLDLESLVVVHKTRAYRFGSVPSGSTRSSETIGPFSLQEAVTSCLSGIEHWPAGAESIWAAGSESVERILRSVGAGNGYAARAGQLLREQAWTATYRDRGSDGLIIGVY